MKPMVSLAMIVRDEAEHLGRCLGSVADLVGEVVVVDTGSTDSTREVARGHGARVFDFPWSDSFSEARNESLRLARGGWAFWLDADEWLDEGARGRFRELVAGLVDDEGVYLMEVACDLAGGDGDGVRVAQPRLFRNVQGVRWEYRVHEQILEAWRLRGAPIRPVDVVIRHSGYRQAPDRLRRKHERNLRLMERDLADRPDDPWALFQLGRGHAEGRFEVAEGYLLRALASAGATGLMRRQIRGMLARGYRERGEAARVRRVAFEGLDEHPGDAALLFESGCLALMEGDLGPAEDAFRRLLASSPDLEERLIGTQPGLRGWWSRNNLAGVCFRQGRLDEAERQWSLALAEKPDAASSWLGLAQLSLAQGRWGDLDRALRQVEEHGPESGATFDGPVLLLRAQAHLAREEFAEARERLAELIARDPAATDPRMLLGWSYLLEGEDLEAAERALRGVLATDPDHPEARRGLEAIRERGARPPRRSRRARPPRARRKVPARWISPDS